MSNVTMLKKLGAKQILGNVAKVVKDLCANDGDVIPVYSIIGQTNGFKSGTGTYGDWYAFQGQMEAVNYVTGEHFAAIQAFIPEPLQTMIMQALEENESVEFAFTVSVKRRDDLERKYEYLVQPHKEASQADPLEKLRALLPSSPALPAPTKAPAKKASAKK